MLRRSNIVRVADWPNQHRTGLERALHAMRRHNRRRKRFAWGPDMLRGVQASWGRWLNWAQCQDGYDSNAPIHDLVTHERVESYVALLEGEGCAAATIRHRVMGLERMMAALAPECNRDWLNAIKFRYPKTGDRAKKRARLQFTNDLIRFASELAEAADELAVRDSIAGALLYRVALQIMWLAYRPMRLKNFQSLHFRTEVKLVDGQWHIDIPASATKRGNPYDPILPPRLVKLLERYRSVHLISLGGAQYDGALWVFENGQQQSARSINYHICAQTEKHFGRSMCPHLFRDAVMTTVSSQMPEHVRMGMHLVGNRDQGCMADHYDQSQRVIADTKYNAALDAWEDEP